MFTHTHFTAMYFPTVPKLMVSLGQYSVAPFTLHMQQAANADQFQAGMVLMQL